MSQMPVLAGVVIAALAVGAAQAADPLRVCASTKEAPFSMEDGTGFENRIAAEIADEMGRELDLVFIKKEAIYLVRDGIEKDLCDVVIGTDTNDPRLLTTRPYYRSAYVLLTPADQVPDKDSWTVLAEPQYETISHRFHGPAETMVKYSGKYENNLIYVTSLVNFEDRRNKYTNVAAERVVSEVAQGLADVGVAFGPEIARYVKDSRKPLTMTVISDEIKRTDGVVIPLAYDQSVGVSKAKPELLEEVQKALDARSAAITAILAEEGIPLLPPSS